MEGTTKQRKVYMYKLNIDIGMNPSYELAQLVRSWEECLTLWKYMSELPSRVLSLEEDDIGDFKNAILDILNIGKRFNGCPFCEKYYDKSSCPLGDCSGEACPCFKTPYARYDKSFDRGYHSQRFAKAFFNYLKAYCEETIRDYMYTDAREKCLYILGDIGPIFLSSKERKEQVQQLLELVPRLYNGILKR